MKNRYTFSKINTALNTDMTLNQYLIPHQTGFVDIRNSVLTTKRVSAVASDKEDLRLEQVAGGVKVEIKNGVREFRQRKGHQIL